jgi:hypothetical protein
LDDPALVAKAINERAQRIKALEAELARLPEEEADAENLEGPKAGTTGAMRRWPVRSSEQLASPRGLAGSISAFASRIEVPLEAWQRAT